MDTRTAPKVSVVVPIHDMDGGPDFLWKLVNSLTEQTLTDWELIITKAGKMAENTNAGIKRARGEYVKILYLDDHLSNTTALDSMVSHMEDSKMEWGIVGVENNQDPEWTYDIETGNNKLGSPSALIFRNRFENNLLFDEKLSWVLDCEFYKRMHEEFGPPLIMPGNYITLGEGPHQTTHKLTPDEKLEEIMYSINKHENRT